MGPTDRELLDGWAAQDAEAGNQLFDRHFLAVYRFFRNKVGDEVDDLVQQTFLACVEGRERFRADASFRTWLLSVARHKLYDRFRENRRDADRFDPEASNIEALGTSPISALANKAELRLLLAALRRIPLTSQIALELYYFEGMRGPAIAEVLDIPEATVRSRLRRGLGQLRREIEALGEGPEVIRSTIDNLDAWAQSLRSKIVGDSAEASRPARPR